MPMTCVFAATANMTTTQQSTTCRVVAQCPSRTESFLPVTNMTGLGHRLLVTIVETPRGGFEVMLLIGIVDNEVVFKCAAGSLTDQLAIAVPMYQ